MPHTMTVAAPARTVTPRFAAVAVKTDIKTGHDIAHVTRGHTSGCAGAIAYYTRTGDPSGTWQGRCCAALGVTGTVQAEVTERLYQEGVGPGGERIIQHAAPKSGEDQAAAEAAAIARYREQHLQVSLRSARQPARGRSPGPRSRRPRQGRGPGQGGAGHRGCPARLGARGLELLEAMAC